MTRTNAAAMCLALTLACTGQIGDPPSSGSPGGPGTGSSGPGSTGTGTSGPGSTGTGVPPPPMSCSDPANDIDNTALRRLTNADYLNTVSDLLGDVSGLNLNFAVELTTENFPFLDNAGAQQTPPEVAHQYFDAAEKIAADTVKNRLSKVLTCDPAAAAG